MQYKEYAEVKKQFLKNFLAACERRKISDAVLWKFTFTDKSNMHNYINNDKSYSEKKIFKWCLQLNIPLEVVFTLDMAMIKKLESRLVGISHTMNEISCSNLRKGEKQVGESPAY